MKGQGSLEYLMIIGGGVLIAVIIIAAVLPLATTSSTGNQILFAHGQCRPFQKEQCNLQTLHIGEEYFVCQFDYDQKECIAKKADVLLDYCTGSVGWESGKVYLLSSDIDEETGPATCFIINQPDVTFSCGGKELNVNTQAFQLSTSNVTIQNCVINAEFRGIMGFPSATSSKLLDNKITIRSSDLSSSGISFIGGTLHRIEGNSIYFLAPISESVAIRLSANVSNSVVKNNFSCNEIPDYLISISNYSFSQNSESGGNTCNVGKCFEAFSGSPVVCSEGAGVSSNCSNSC